jgi:hypothetical protein
MKRTTIWLPEDLADRLTVESARTGIKTAELIRRAVAAVTPPVRASAGELRKRIERLGFLNVRVLDARDGYLLVEPGDGGEGLFESAVSIVQIWVPAHTVTFPETADPIPAALLARSIPKTPPDLRLNLMAAPRKKPDDMGDLMRTNLMIPAGSLPVPSKCGICGAPFPSKAAKKRHVRDAHSTPIPPTGASKS